MLIVSNIRGNIHIVRLFFISLQSNVTADMEIEKEKQENWPLSRDDDQAGREERSDSISVFTKMMRAVFGIFMIVIYVGMGVLLLVNFFNWEDGNWSWTRYLVGVVLIVYGLWRGWRQYKGLDYYGR